MQTETTKICNKCSNDKLVCLRSTNEKICPNCYNVIPWNLSEGQKSLITNNRYKGVYNEYPSKST